MKSLFSDYTYVTPENPTIRSYAIEDPVGFLDPHLSLHQDYFFWQDSNANEVDVLQENAAGSSVYEIKATQTISSNLFKQMDRFETMSAPVKVRKTLIYGGHEDQKRTHYNVISWRNISDGNS